MIVELVKHRNGEVLEWRWAQEHELIKLPKFTSCYYIDGLLIDTTGSNGKEKFREFIEDLINNQRKSIEFCILTHYHEDHSGAADILYREFNIPVYAREDSIEVIKKGFTIEYYRQLYWGELELSGDELKPLSEVISPDGKIITPGKKYSFEIVETPGHSLDLISLVDKENEIIFTSDSVMPRYQMLFGKGCEIQEDIKQIYQSIKKLYAFAKEMKDPLILVSHDQARSAEFLLERLEEIRDLHKKVHQLNTQFIKEGVTSERKRIKKILRELFAGESMVGRLTHGELSRENLVASLLKHEDLEN